MGGEDVQTAGLQVRRSASSGSGSYLAMRQMKESYQTHKSSPLKNASTRPGASPSKEVAYLQAELQRMQHLNAEMTTKLCFAEARVPGLAKILGLDLPAADGSVHVTASRGSVQLAGGAMVLDCSSGSSISTGKEQLPATLMLDDLLLSAEEEEEAAMRCCWLAHYWSLAEQYGVCADIAGELAAYWQERSMPEEGFYEIARKVVAPFVSKGLLEADSQPSSLPGATYATHARKSHNGFDSSMASLVEVERGLRQLHELGVVQEVHVSMMHHSHLRQGARLTVVPGSVDAAAGSRSTTEGGIDPLLLFDPEDPSCPPTLPSAAAPALAGAPGSPGPAWQQQQAAALHSSLSSGEREEACFQRAWLAYIWGRAAAEGVEPAVAEARAEHWGTLLLSTTAACCTGGVAAAATAAAAYAFAAPIGVRDLLELEDALVELQRLGVEQQLWQARGSGGHSAVGAGGAGGAKRQQEKGRA